MALSHEDKKDVAGAMGKAIANKVSKVTKDYRSGGLSAGQRIERSLKDEKSGNYVKLKYSSDKHQSSLHGTPISARGDKSGTTHHFKAKRP